MPSKTLWGRQVVDSVGYTPNPDNTNWQQKGSWKSPKRTEHAEIQGWREISFRTTPRVVLFLQDVRAMRELFPLFSGTVKKQDDIVHFCCRSPWLLLLCQSIAR